MKHLLIVSLLSLAFAGGFATATLLGETPDCANCDYTTDKLFPPKWEGGGGKEIKAPDFDFGPAPE
jgi:hypothetical protein